MATVPVSCGRPENEATSRREAGHTGDIPGSGVPGLALVPVLPVVTSSSGSVGYFNIPNVPPFPS